MTEALYTAAEVAQFSDTRAALRGWTSRIVHELAIEVGRVVGEDAARITALTARVAALDAAVVALSDRVAAMEFAIAPPPPPV